MAKPITAMLTSPTGETIPLTFRKKGGRSWVGEFDYGVMKIGPHAWGYFVQFIDLNHLHHHIPASDYQPLFRTVGEAVKTATGWYAGYIMLHDNENVAERVRLSGDRVAQMLSSQPYDRDELMRLEDLRIAVIEAEAAILSARKQVTYLKKMAKQREGTDVGQE